MQKCLYPMNMYVAVYNWVSVRVCARACVIEKEQSCDSQLEDHVEHAVRAVCLHQLYDVRVLQHVTDTGLSLQICGGNRRDKRWKPFFSVLRRIRLSSFPLFNTLFLSSSSSCPTAYRRVPSLSFSWPLHRADPVGRLQSERRREVKRRRNTSGACSFFRSLSTPTT